MANLLQVSSALGRAMETVNRTKLSKAIYPALLEAKAQGTLTASEISNAISCCAEGYSFPTNLDNDPPVGGLAPKTQADIMTEALADQMSVDALNAQLDALSQRQQS
jgi:ectoine hydroxylase-related dioxygenase (phytanoyl-CoA dioxygenase family)